MCCTTCRLPFKHPITEAFTPSPTGLGQVYIPIAERVFGLDGFALSQRLVERETVNHAWLGMARAQRPTPRGATFPSLREQDALWPNVIIFGQRSSFGLLQLFGADVPRTEVETAAGGWVEIPAHTRRAA